MCVGAYKSLQVKQVMTCWVNTVPPKQKWNAKHCKHGQIKKKHPLSTFQYPSQLRVRSVAAFTQQKWVPGFFGERKKVGELPAILRHLQPFWGP